MKKILIYVLCAVVLLGIGFFIGFCFGSEEEEQQVQRENSELVEDDDSEIAKQHELNSQLDIKLLASIMLEERSTQHLNESLYVSYLVDSLGFVLEDRYDSRRWWRPGSKEFLGGGMTLFLSSGMEDGQAHRYISIEGGNIGEFIQDLVQLGLEYEGGEDGFCEYGGRGLYAGTSPRSIQFGILPVKTDKQ